MQQDRQPAQGALDGLPSGWKELSGASSPSAVSLRHLVAAASAHLRRQRSAAPPGGSPRAHPGMPGESPFSKPKTEIGRKCSGPPGTCLAEALIQAERTRRCRWGLITCSASCVLCCLVVPSPVVRPGEALGGHLCGALRECQYFLRFTSRERGP